MWTYHPELLTRAVPRYTSYPTAAEFHDRVGHDDMESALDTVANGTPVSLYLHIPYCREICWYCGCNTGAANRSARLTAYLARLHEEIDLVAARLSGRERITRIAFGGGSPNAIPPAEFGRLVAHARKAFRSDDAVLSVELDPRGFDASWGAAIHDAGVTRASLGVQTFDTALQARIGRVQPTTGIARTVELLREAGVTSINFDLMYGLPGQGMASLSATMEQALALSPERLAVFGYAHVPHLIPRQRRIAAHDLPDVKERFGLAAYAHDRLTGAGYAAVGFDHFAHRDDALARAAQDGTLRRNFQGFTEDPADVLIGLGASAISQFPDRILQNEKNAGRWHMAIEQGCFATTRGLHRSRQDQLRGAAIESILCQGRADLSGIPDAGAIANLLAPYEALGLVHREGARLRLANDALPYARTIAATLDTYRQENTVRFSHAV